LSVHLPPPPALHTLSLHDALPICAHNGRMTDATTDRRVLITGAHGGVGSQLARELAAEYDLVLHFRRAEDAPPGTEYRLAELDEDRKSTRLNSSHVSISYAVFCLK